MFTWNEAGEKVLYFPNTLTGSLLLRLADVSDGEVNLHHQRRREG